jgi:hypothetical protein
MNNPDCILFLESKDLKQLNKMIKKDNDVSQVILPHTLKSNEYMIWLPDRSNSLPNQIMGFIWFGIFEDLESNIKYIGINYSYTFIKYRNRGTNTKLRLFVEKFASNSNIQLIKSIGLPGSDSIKIMNKLNWESTWESTCKSIYKSTCKSIYESEPTYFCKKII